MLPLSLLQSSLLSVFIDSFHISAIPTLCLIWHFPGLCIMLWEFLQLLMNTYVLFQISLLLLYLSFFFLSLLPSNSSWKTRKQASSLGPIPLLAARSMEQKTHTHKHTHTSPTPNTLRSELLTQIRIHWSHPQWNESGESQVNIAVYRHVFANSNA